MDKYDVWFLIGALMVVAGGWYYSPGIGSILSGSLFMILSILGSLFNDKDK